MAKRNLIKTEQFPYHVTARSNNQEFFLLPLEFLWDLIIEKSKHVTKMYQAEILAFVLMSNHYHMLIKTPLSNIDEIMEYFQREIAKKANRHASRINHFFGGPYKWSIVDSQNYFFTVLKYIYQNPVRAGIVKNVEDYPFSTVKQFVLQKCEHGDFPLAKGLVVSYFESFDWDEVRMIDWLNDYYSDDEIETIKLSLKNAYMKFPRSKSSVGRRKVINNWDF